MNKPEIPPGKYEHYRTKQVYELVGFARHHETQEEMVIYKALYDCEEFGKNQVWVRPKKMFTEEVTHNGEVLPRFKWIGG